MKIVTRRLFVMLVLSSILWSPEIAVGQNDGLEDEQRAGQAAPPRSFSEAFFIARKTDPSGEKSVEMIGSLIIWFLLLLSVLSLGLIGHMALANQRRSIVPKGVVEEVRRLIAAGKYREALELSGRDESFFSQVLRAGLSEASHGFAAVIRRLELTADELTTVRLRRIEYLNVLGQVSPMIGLFGTVYGMILAFSAIVASGGNADPILLAGGIGTALTTTFWGLLVAIPALAGYAIIRNKIDELTTEATMTAEELVNQFRPKAAGRAAAGEPKPAVRVKAPAP
ncbi:MAG: MotA/TolQ/ExbB proton channel family protein [Planctomycetota bacterium]|jgi:biopolymer transport protein ExbB